MKFQFANIKNTLKNNVKVIENYSFMTLLNVANVVIQLISYPYVIKTLGTETYGLYVFVLSAALIFGEIISFSTDVLGTKEIAQNSEDIGKKSEIISSVVFLRLFLFILSFILLLILSLLIPFVAKHLYLYIFCFLGNLGRVLFHPWYFQGIQKMKIVTYIKVAFNLLQLPFIFLFINTKSDLLIYALIIVSLNNLGALYGFIHLLLFEKIKIYWTGTAIIINRIKISLPFLYKSIIGILKSQISPQLLGNFLGMHEVAIYNLANKILMIPITMIWNVNNAFFPKFAKHHTAKSIYKLMKFEVLLGLSFIFGCALLGKFAVAILGGATMSQSYYILLILSLNILNILIVGGYIDFVFVLNNKTDLVFKNQIVSFVTYISLASLGLWLTNSIYSLPIAVLCTGILEISFCHWNYKKMKQKNQLYIENNNYNHI